MMDINSILQQHQQSAVKSTCEATKAARAYLLDNDAAIKPGALGYLQGYQITDTTQIVVRNYEKMQSIWCFDIISDGFATSYQIRSYLDSIDAQVSYNTWITVYQLLMIAVLQDPNAISEIRKDEPF